MPNIAQALREEIERVTKKELRAELKALRQENADIKKQLTALQRQLNRTGAAPASSSMPAAAAVAATVKAAPSKAADRARITGKMVRRMRDRLKLTQAELAALLDVSPQSVYQWERKGGPLTFRKDTKAKLVAIRDMGIKEAQQALQGSGGGSESPDADADSETKRLPRRKSGPARKRAASKKKASGKKTASGKRAAQKSKAGAR